MRGERNASGHSDYAFSFLLSLFLYIKKKGKENSAKQTKQEELIYRFLFLLVYVPPLPFGNISKTNKHAAIHSYMYSRE